LLGPIPSLLRTKISSPSWQKISSVDHPYSTLSISSADMKNEFHPPNTGPCRKDYHSAYAFEGYSYKNAALSQPPTSVPIIQNLKLQFVEDNHKWKLLNEKLDKHLISILFPGNCNSLDLDTLASESSLLICKFLEKECGIRVKKCITHKLKKSKFTRAYYRLRARKRLVRPRIKKLRKESHVDKHYLRFFLFPEKGRLFGLLCVLKSRT